MLGLRISKLGLFFGRIGLGGVHIRGATIPLVFFGALDLLGGG